MSSNLKVNSLVPATGTEIGIGTTGGSIDFRCPATFGGNVTIGGTLTYDEVINIDSIGIVTARSGLNVQAGQLDVGSNIKLGNAGVVTATTFSGSGASLTGIANANISASAAIGGEKINPAFTSNVTITNTAPRLDFVDSNNNSDYRITNSNGTFVFYDTTNAATRLSIASNGNVSVTNDLDVDGHTNLDNVSISGITTTNQITISSSGPRLTFSDSNENPDFYIEVNASQFLIQDATANAQRFRIQSNGVVDINGNTNFGGGIDVTGGPITATGDLDVDGHTNLDNVSIAGVTTFSEDTKFIGAISGRDLQWDKSDNSLEFLDYTTARFGTDNNLTIYHNAGNNNSYISENGVGSLLIQASDLYLTNTAGEYYVICATDGRVQLNFNGNDKLQTTNTGVKLSSGVSGSVSNILQLDHNGNNNGDGPKITFSRAGTIRTEIESLKNETSNNETDIIFRTTAAGSLGEKLRIDSTGNLKQGTSTPTAFTGGAPSSTQRFLGKKCMQGSVTSTVTLSGSGTGTFDLGRLWLTDDSVTEIFLQVMRNDTALYNSHYCKAFIQKVRGSGMTQGHILYQNGAHAGFSVSSIQSGGYTASGGASHGTQISVTGGHGGVIYRMTCFYTTISKNDMY